MKCPKCGKKLADSAVVCPACGRHIKRAATNMAVVEKKSRLPVYKILTAALIALAVALIVLVTLPWINVVSLSGSNAGEVFDRITLYGFEEVTYTPLFFFGEAMVITAQALVLGFVIFGRKRSRVWPSALALTVAALLCAYLFSGMAKLARAGGVDELMSSYEASMSATSSTASVGGTSAVVSAPAESEDNPGDSGDGASATSSFTYRASAESYIFAALSVAELGLAVLTKAQRKRDERTAAEKEADARGKARGRAGERNKLIDDLFNGENKDKSE